MYRFATIIMLISFAACTKKSVERQTMSPEELQKRGDMVYHSFCVACHHRDPHQEGILGPAVTGSSLELLQERILHATYPNGYQPKRPTKIMYAIPQIEKDIPAIHAYLNSN